MLPGGKELVPPTELVLTRDMSYSETTALAKQIEEGAPADLLVLPADPGDDLAVLAAPTAVLLRGRPI